MEMVKISIVKVTDSFVVAEGYFGNGLERKRLSKSNYEIVGKLLDNQVAYIVDDCFITRTPSDI